MPTSDLDEDLEAPLADPQAEAFRQRQRRGKRRELVHLVAGPMFQLHPWFRWLPLLVLPCVALPTVPLALGAPGQRVMERELPICMGLLVLLIAFMASARWLLAERLVAEEERWLSALGFEVRGWFDALKKERKGCVRVTLSFRDAPPDPQRLRTWLAAVGARSNENPLVATSPCISVTFHTGRRGSTTTSAVEFLRWQRHLIQHALVSVHQVFPLERVVLQWVHPE